MAVYGNLEASGNRSLASLQWSLKGFYGTILMILASAVVVVTPALTASSIASERQRRSLDLILSTPLQIKSYLVGKLIASYRYTWLLLILSLPLVSMCIILGGATWQEVILGYVRLSLFGLLFTAIGLLMSVMAPRPVSAIAYSYIAVAFFVFVSTLTTSVGSAGSTSGTSGGIYVLASLNPFFDAMMLSSSQAYDNLLIAWLPLALFVAVACKIVLLGAGSVLSGYGSRHTSNLRWHVLGLCVVVIGVLTYQLPDSLLMMASGIFSPSGPTALAPYGQGFADMLAVTSSGMLCYAGIQIGR